MLKNKNTNKIIVLVLTILLFITIIFNINKQKEKIQTFANENQNKQFAMYIEKDNNYEIYNENSFPNIYRYHLNEEESYCQDNKGNRLSNLITPNYDGSITVTSNKTAYCYLYFDEEFRGTGIELSKSESKGLSTEVKGGMYRYQGQQADGIDNYICFGTEDINKCKSDTDHYMYRIIGVEESGRIKVIKKEALNSAYPWWDNYDDDISFPESRIYETISGSGFLENSDYVPKGWEEKIDTNTWMYGDMPNNSTIGARQTGEGLYLTETGQKETSWDAKANEGDPGAQPHIVEHTQSPYIGQTFYSVKHENEKWTKSFEGKVSLMYLHDYNYSVSDTANCQTNEGKYAECQTGWLNLSQNDSGAPKESEWVMTRYGWSSSTGYFHGHIIGGQGYISYAFTASTFSTRPVFYLKNGIYFEGKGTEEEPFVIKEGKAATYIKNQNPTPNGLKLDKIRGDIYRFQGQQADGIENYICFGTSDKDKCTKDTDHYMYRIIGIEAGTGRIKVIKKESLNEGIQWWNNYDDNVEFPDSNVYTSINGDTFLNNKNFIPNGWEEKISINTWMYGDMPNLNSVETSAEIYQKEIGQEDVLFYSKANKDDPGAISYVVSHSQSQYKDQTIYYINKNEKWTKSVIGKVSLMYLHDYNYAVSDMADCLTEKYVNCYNSWIHLSQNDQNAPRPHEWTMTRHGFDILGNWYGIRAIQENGNLTYSIESNPMSVRPVFYLNANVNISSGDGTETNPFMIAE